MNDGRPYFFDLEPDELTALVTGWGLPAFRAKQVLEWVYRKHVADPEKMLNISKMDRQVLGDKLRLTRGRIVEHQSASDGVQKLLIDWPPPEVSTKSMLHVLGSSATQTECVMIPAGGAGRPDTEAEWNDGDEEGQGRSASRRTACVSSQIGCPVGCKFCASGVGGLDGNLSAGQIVEQVWRLGTLPGVIDADDSTDAKPITHVVFMGMGEPLANFEAVAGAIRRLTAPWGLGISARRITVSTVGLPAQIRRLAALEIPVTLAISLHAPNDGLRRKLIPWAEFVTVRQLIDAARDYFDATGRQVTLEYILLRQVNDRPEHARELAGLARELSCNVNLIRYNEVKSLPFDRPTTTDVHQFQAVLRRAGISAHIRASRGRDIAAACGQLRHEQAGAGGGGSGVGG